MRRELKPLQHHDALPVGALCLTGAPAETSTQIAADLAWIERCVASRRHRRPEPPFPSPHRA